MSNHDFFMLSPLLILAGASVLVMLIIAFRASHQLTQQVSLISFIAAFVSVFYIKKDATAVYTIDPLLTIDSLAIFIIGLIIFSSIVVNILSYIYFEEKEENPREYYILLFLATLGACVLAVSSHFVSLFLGLEILTVSLYALISYLRGRHLPIEAGVKYLILAAFSSAFLLFGMAMIYMQTGSMSFVGIGASVATFPAMSPLFATGLGLILIGVGFKLAVVPFHMWTADVYQGAPAPVTAFIATVSKGGMFAVFLRFFTSITAFQFTSLILTLICIAIASMFIGNLLALKQNNVKRILAYSSIAHLGYLLVAFIPGSLMTPGSVSIYLLAYSITTLTAFGVVTLLSTKDSDAEDIESYRGLFWQRPLLACIFTAALLSLAGIPLTVGFFGKFYILAAALRSGYWILSIILVISSVIGLFYYLRIITTMFSGEKVFVASEPRPFPVFYLASSITLSVLMILIVLLGSYPALLMDILGSLQYFVGK
jgi:NADH-quinone oxidoreductase subunit N